MSVRTSSSSSSHSSSGGPSSPVTTTTVGRSQSLKSINGYIDSCTYVKQKDRSNQYGCYLFRSCQSCLESDGCMVNDLGICVSQFSGMNNLETGYTQDSTSYYSKMNYLKAIEKNLSLPKARTSNSAALANEQNWHFRAGEATYCKAKDAVCTECKANNFWHGNASSTSSAYDGTLPDSRFCVGQDGCVCIQSCEVPAFKSPGCQWKLSSSSPSYYGSGSSTYTYPTTVTHLAFWEWMIVLLMVIGVHLLFRCCSSKRQREAAREEAVRAVRRELGIPETEPVTAPVSRPVRRTATEITDDSSIHDDSVQEVKTPRPGDDAAAADTEEAVFVEIKDLRPMTASPSQQHSASSRTQI